MFEAYCREKLGPLALRLALGLACAYHGYLKIMASGGTAWQPGVPVGWQLLLSWGEFSAGLAILLGCYCRLAALVVLVLTAGTLAWWHGWNVLHLPIRILEPSILLILMSLALLFLGAGDLSIDRRSGGKPAAAKDPRKKLAA